VGSNFVSVLHPLGGKGTGPVLSRVTLSEAPPQTLAAMCDIGMSSIAPAQWHALYCSVNGYLLPPSSHLCVNERRPYPFPLPGGFIELQQKEF